LDFIGGVSLQMMNSARFVDRGLLVDGRPPFHNPDWGRVARDSPSGNPRDYLGAAALQVLIGVFFVAAFLSLSSLHCCSRVIQFAL